MMRILRIQMVFDVTSDVASGFNPNLQPRVLLS